MAWQEAQQKVIAPVTWHRLLGNRLSIVLKKKHPNDLEGGKVQKFRQHSSPSGYLGGGPHLNTGPFQWATGAHLDLLLQGLVVLKEVPVPGEIP